MSFYILNQDIEGYLHPQMHPSYYFPSKVTTEFQPIN